MKVTCINDDHQDDYSERVVKGRAYEVAGVGPGYKIPDENSGEVGRPCYDLVGLNPVSLRYGLALCWNTRRFRAPEMVAPPFSASVEELQTA